MADLALRRGDAKGAGSNRVPVHDDINGVTTWPRHSRRVNGQRERRFQIDPLLRCQRDAPQLEHLGCTRSARFHKVHRHIDQKLLRPSRRTLQSKPHGHSAANPHAASSEYNSLNGDTWRLPVAEQRERVRVTAFDRAPERVFDETPPLGRSLRQPRASRADQQFWAHFTQVVEVVGHAASYHR